MINLSFGIFVVWRLNYTKRGVKVFIAKNFENPDNTEFKSIIYINRFTLTKSLGGYKYV